MDKNAELLVEVFGMSIEDARRIALAISLPRDDPKQWRRVAEIIDSMGKPEAQEV